MSDKKSFCNFVEKRKTMKFIVTSDIHGHLPHISACDFFIIGGDIFPKEMDREVDLQEKWYHEVFEPWMEQLPCRYLIMVPGNHDYFLEKLYNERHLQQLANQKLKLLCNNSMRLEGFTFYGTPNTLPPKRNFAFCQESAALNETFQRIPQQLDILVSHAAPYDIGRLAGVEDDLDVGSPELTEALKSRKIRYVFCGHIHQGNHKRVKWNGSTLYNVARCNNQKEVGYPLLTMDINPR